VRPALGGYPARQDGSAGSQAQTLGAHGDVAPMTAELSAAAHRDA
jgi:hypothetical protein